eukprot:4734528-Amphidinium_carterae.1
MGPSKQITGVGFQASIALTVAADPVVVTRKLISIEDVKGVAHQLEMQLSWYSLYTTALGAGVNLHGATSRANIETCA